MSKPTGSRPRRTSSPFETTEREFLRKHPGEAKRRLREAKREAAHSRLSRPYVAERDDKLARLALPRGKTVRQRGRSTSLQRGVAEVLAGRTVGDAIPDPEAAPNWRQSRVDLARTEHAQRAASMVTAARDFYAQVKRTYSRQSDLKREIGPIMVSNQRWREHMRSVVGMARAARATPRDFAASVSAAGAPALPPKCRHLVDLARAILRCSSGPLKDIGPERGPKAGTWRGSITINFSIAGVFAGGRGAMANHTRTVEVELLAPERLTVLYATGPRGGPAEAAKTMVAAILGRSRAAVEAMVSQVRSTENADAEKN